MTMRTLSLLLLFPLLLPAVQAATLVKQVNIEQLTADSQRIFLGTCTSLRSGRDSSGLPSTVYTFEIQRGLKGVTGRTLRIKQFGAVEPLPDGGILRIQGMPEYRVGESYLLFLTPESELGFTSPEGLGQGVFQTYRDASTRQILVENSDRNQQLFRNLTRESRAAAAPVPQGPLPLEQLLTVITQLLEK